METIYKIAPGHTRKISFTMLVLFFFIQTASAKFVGYNYSDEDNESRKQDSLKNELTLVLPDTTRVNTLNDLAACYKDHNPSEAILYTKQSLILADSIHYKKGKANAHLTMGASYHNMADYSNALRNFIEALKLYEELHDMNHEATTLSNIGVIYIRLEKYDLAEKYLSRAARISETTNVINVGIIYNNIGVTKMQRGLLKESIVYFKKGVELNRKYKRSNTNIAGGLSNLGEVYFKLNKINEAEKYYQEALSTKETSPYLLIDVYNSLGKLYTEKKEYAKASEHLFEAKELAENTGIKHSLSIIYKDLSHMFLQQGDYKNAFLYSEKYNVLKDSIDNETLTKQISEMQEKYESEKKDKAIQVLSKNEAIAEAKSKREGLYRNFLFVIAILILTICFFLYRNIRQKKKHQIEIEKKNDELNSYNKELMIENVTAKYEVLKSKTNPHFLFNSLASLSDIVKDHTLATEFLECFTDLYRMTLETGNSKVITLREEMKLVNSYLYLEKVRFGDNIEITINVANHLLQRCVAPFAIQMVVENAFKHNIITTTKKLYITIYSGDNEIVIKNNLQKKNSGVTSTFTGQKNILERYRFLSAVKPEFIETQDEYIVKIPLLSAEKEEAYTD